MIAPNISIQDSPPGAEVYPGGKLQSGARFPHYPEGVPAELKEGAFWVACAADKAPMIASPTLNRAASSTDPKTWRSYTDALAAYESGRFAGIGRVLTPGYVGIDIDGCMDRETGEITPEAWEIIRYFDSYTEISPSGKGVKIWIRADLDYSRVRGGLEVYRSHGRYFTVTGQFLAQFPDSIEDRQDELEAFIAKEFPEPERKRKKYEGNGFNGEFDLASWLEWHEVEILGYTPDDRGGVYSIVCPWVHEHTGGDTSGTKIGRATADGGTWFHCHHAHCAERDYFDFRDKVAPRAKVGLPTVTDVSDVSDVFSRGERKKAQTPPFPTDALPAKVARYVQEAAASLSCPPELVAIPALGAISGLMGRTREIRIKRGWVISGSLYLLVVAPSGEKKSPAQAVAIYPVEKIQGTLRKAYNEEKKAYEQAMREYRADKKLAAKDGKPEPEPPPRPVMRRCIVDDITVEALATRLEENPRGFLSAQDELTGFLRGMDQYKSGGKGNARQIYLKIWSNGAITVDRKGADEPVVVPKPYVTIQGGIQPAVLHEIADGRDDGFLDRWLTAYPEPTPGGYSHEEVSGATEFAYEDLLTRVLDRGAETQDQDGDIEPKVLQMDEEAKRLFIAEADKLATEKWAPGFAPALRGPWSKMDTQLAKLALILAVVRCADEGGAEYVSGDDMRAGLRLLEYFKATTRKVYGQLFEANPDDILAADVSAFLSKTGNSIFKGTVGKLKARMEEEGLTAGLPDDVRGLGRALDRIAKQLPQLHLEKPPRGDERIIILTLEKNDGNVGNDGEGSVPELSPSAESAVQSLIDDAAYTREEAVAEVLEAVREEAG